MCSPVGLWGFAITTHSADAISYNFDFKLKYFKCPMAKTLGVGNPSEQGINNCS